MSVDTLAYTRDITNDLWAELDGGMYEPHSLRAERCLLASLLRNNLQYDVLAKHLDADCFYDLAHRDIWKVFEATLGNQRRRPEFAGKMQGIHPAYIQEMLGRSGVWGNRHELAFEEISRLAIPSDVAAVYAGVLSELNRRRKTAALLSEALNALLERREDVDDRVMKLIADAAKAFGSDEKDAYNSSAYAIAEEIREEWDALRKGLKKPFIPTGIDVFDASIHGGFHDGAYTIGGLSGHGKSTLAIGTANGVLENPAPSFVHIYSTEMTRLQVAYRLFATKYDKLTESDFTKPHKTQIPEAFYDEVLEWFEQQPLAIHNDGSTTIDVQKVINDVRATRAEHPDAHITAIVDYIQYCRCPWLPRSADKIKHIEEAAQELNALGSSMKGLTVVILTQYTAENGALPITVPDPEQSRYSKTIHHAAATYTSFHRPFKGHPELGGLTMLVTGKSRYGDEGISECWTLAWSDMDQKSFAWCDDEKVPAEYATEEPSFDCNSERERAEFDGRVENFARKLDVHFPRITRGLWRRRKEALGG